MKLTTSLLLIPAASFILAVAVGSGACSSSASPAGTGGASITTPFGTCSSATGYIVVDATACDGAGLSCATDYYALCDGTTFASCSCSAPSGGTVITDPVGVPSSDLPGDAGPTSEASAPTEAGSNPTEAGSTPTEAGSTPTEAGSNPTEAGSAPTEAGTGSGS